MLFNAKNLMKIMNFKYLLLSILVILFSCEKSQIKELPDNLLIVEISENLADSLFVILPPGVNIFQTQTEFFDPEVQKNIVLTKASKVYVTFIDEGAGYKNSLGWYSYNITNPPASVEDIKGGILFPNISKVNEGGLLEPGFTLQVGESAFPAGTVIGFFLIVKGWENGKINYDKLTHYTDFDFNLGGHQQHLLFKNAFYDTIIMGFEDQSIDDLEGAVSDKDYNDILFSISDNDKGVSATSFDLSTMLVK